MLQIYILNDEHSQRIGNHAWQSDNQPQASQLLGERAYWTFALVPGAQPHCSVPQGVIHALDNAVIICHGTTSTQIGCSVLVDALIMMHSDTLHCSHAFDVI